jgi:hypothetical protein
MSQNKPNELPATQPVTVTNTWKLTQANTTPILEHVAAHLQPRDLYCLARTCQSAANTLNLHQPTSKANFLSKTLCSGEGMITRSFLHKTSQSLGRWTFKKLSKCGGLNDDVTIESRSCATCGINTCDECRFHLVYHSLLETPGLDAPRWWAGYVNGMSFPVRLFPSKDVMPNSPWHTSERPQHDHGLLGIHFDMPWCAKPEPIDRILGADQG